jgi:hypothetical protein
MPIYSGSFTWDIMAIEKNIQEVPFKYRQKPQGRDKMSIRICARLGIKNNYN